MSHRRRATAAVMVAVTGCSFFTALMMERAMSRLFMALWRWPCQWSTVPRLQMVSAFIRLCMFTQDSFLDLQCPLQESSH